MLSTLKILRNRSLLHVDLILKGNKADFHVCFKKAEPLKTYSNLWRRKIPVTPLLLQHSINFMSTEPPLDETKKSSEQLLENVPEPPLPVTDPIDVLPVSPRDEELISFLQALIKEEGATIKPKPEEILPQPPTPIQDLPYEEGAMTQVSGEPSFESIGLGGWSPVGIVENCLEFLHVNCDLPWWTSIVIGTIVVRTLLFPLVILSQRNAAKMNNHLPEMQAIQLKMSDARERGDRLDAARYAQELMMFMKEKQLNPLKNMLVPLAQAPLFISFFMGLRAMANLPVESLKEGGLFWFVDLTLPDQFYLLPIITCATLLVTIEVGTDAARMNSANMGMMKYFLRAMPVIIFPFTLGFPAAILVYWTSTNFISLIQVSILKIPRVRKYFNIDPLVKHDTQKLPIREKGFVKGVKDSWTNMRITRELEERERIDEINFSRAGKGAVKKTYKYDPTQTRPPRNIGAIQVKKRD